MLFPAEHLFKSGFAGITICLPRGVCRRFICRGRLQDAPEPARLFDIAFGRIRIQSIMAAFDSFFDRSNKIGRRVRGVINAAPYRKPANAVPCGTSHQIRILRDNSITADACKRGPGPGTSGTTCPTEKPQIRAPRLAIHLPDKSGFAALQFVVQPHGKYGIALRSASPTIIDGTEVPCYRYLRKLHPAGVTPQRFYIDDKKWRYTNEHKHKSFK